MSVLQEKADFEVVKDSETENHDLSPNLYKKALLYIIRMLEAILEK